MTKSDRIAGKPRTDGAGSRRGGGLRALSTTLPRVAQRALGRRGFAEGGLVTEWPAIVGSELAAVCAPRRLSFPHRDRHHDGTLTLRVEPGHALTLQHLEPQLVERINGYFGYRAVARLRLQQGPLAARRPRPKPPAPFDAEAEADIRARTADVEDERLRDALLRLGRAVRGRQDRT